VHEFALSHEHRLSHLSDSALLRDLAALVAKDRLTTASLLAHLAEVDARRLYAPAGYPSLYAFCVEELHLSEDAASKRIQAARAARRFPALFAALADGRLHLSAVCLLAPHLTAENAAELIEAATHRRRSEIEGYLVRKFSTRGVPATVRAVPTLLEHAPGHVRGVSVPPVALDEHAPGPVDDPGREGTPPPGERYLVRLTIGKATHDKLRYARPC
jgi:hypothetical protein